MRLKATPQLGEHQPSEHQPSEHQPSEHQPSEHQPSERKPSERKPSERQLSERKPSERQLSDDRLRMIIDSAPAGVVMVDHDGRITLVNTHTEILFGYARAELLGQPIEMLVPDRYRPGHGDRRQGFLVNPNTRRMGEGRDLYGLRKDGTEFPVEIGLNPIDTPEGLSVLGVITDITERKRNDERLRVIIESAPAGVVMVDQEGHITLVNTHTETLFGYARAELLGQPIEMLVPQRYRPGHGDRRRGFLANPNTRRMGEGRDLYGLRKDGTEFPVEIGLNPIMTPEGLSILGVITDITERKRNDERLRVIIESAPAGVVMVDRGGRISLVNTLTETLFGYSRAELLGQPIEMLVPQRYRPGHAGLRDSFLGNPNTRRMGEGRDLFGMRKDGTEFPVEIGLNPIMTPEGLSILGVITDITERKRAEAELRRKTDELVRSNRDLEQFAYVASHDLQEPLRAVAGCVQLLQARYGGKLDARADEFIQHAVDGANRMRTLIDDLLAYSRIGRAERAAEPVDCQRVFNEALRNLKVAISESGAAITHDPLPTIFGHAAELTLVFQNLIGNAIKFRRADRPIHIHVGAAAQGNEWLLSVKDNGIGIETQYLDRIFVIFQRLHTRQDYPGTGIGLSLCKRVVEHHGGNIWAESDPGQGTTISFTLRGPVDAGESAFII